MIPPAPPAAADIDTRVEAAFLAACRMELQALKPGNVHVFAAGHGMTVADFELSAVAAAPFVARRGARIGRRVLEGVAATRAAVGQNTNLGILLLAAPLAAAAERGGDLRAAVAAGLAGLDRSDAEAVFAAIRLAAPGGLGAAPEHDVNGPATDLAAAMAAAADRDSIARQYVTGFRDVWTLGLPALDAAIGARGFGPEAISDLYLSWLAALPDSHVQRKHGAAAARAVMETAAALRPAFAGAFPAAQLAALDAAWKARDINPGTAADLTVATILSRLLADNR